MMRTTIATATFLATAGAALASDAFSWDVSGYAETRLYEYVGAETDPHEIDLRLRPRLKLTLADGGSVVIEPELRHAFGRNEDRFDGWEDNVGMERLYAEFDYPKANVVLGKQAVNWGSALVFNPTDTFDDVYLRDPWAEVSGHPALRVSVPLSATSEIAALVASDDRFGEGLLAARGRLNVGTTDIAFSAARDPFRGADLVGLDVKGEATVGLWLEAAWQSPWDDGSRPSSTDPFVRAVAGTDYTFGVRNGLYTAVQYYHDGSGASDETRYDLPGYVRGERSTLARHYATLTGRLAWSDTLTFATLTIANLVDGSILSTTYGEYVGFENVTVSLGGTFLTGDEGEFNPPQALDPTGLLPDAVAFLWVRYHF